MNNRQTIDSTSKAIREASERKAKKLHFYQNGRPFDTKLTVSIIPGKEFIGLEQFYQFLTEKTQLYNGVQYIFALNGELIRSLDELEHDQTYIISSTKNLINYQYGASKTNSPRILNNSFNSKTRFVREDDLKLIRPLSSKYNNVYSSANTSGHCNVTPQNRDIRTVIIVNNKNHDINSKVILNLKSPKSFDLLLNDLGDAVQLKSPKIMFTSNGQMVKSVSQLKHDLPHINLFYIDNEYPHESLSIWDDLGISQQTTTINYPLTTTSCNHCNGFPQQPNTERIPHSPSKNPSSAGTPTEMVPVTKSNETTTTTTIISTRDKRNHIVDSPKSKMNPQLISPAPYFIDKPNNKQYDHGIVFGFEQLSPHKYEQIQLYVEKLLNDTSLQIKNEVLAQEKIRSIPVNAMDNLKIPDKIESPVTDLKSKQKRTKTNFNNNQGMPSKQKTKVTKNQTKERKVDFVRRTSKNFNSLNKNNLSIQERGSKVSLPSLSKSNEKINEISKNKNLGHDLGTRLSRDQVLSQSTLSIASCSRSPTGKRSLSPNPATIRKTVSDNKLNESKKENIVKKTTPITNQRPVRSKPRTANINKDLANVNKKRDSDSKIKIRQVDIEKHLRGGISIPNYYLSLDRIFGYNGKKFRSLVYLTTGELAYYSGVYAILWNHHTGKQRFYAEHENDICCLRVDPTCEYIATCHLTNTGSMMIRIWSIKTLTTIKILTNKMEFIDMEFTVNNFLFILTGGIESNISLWNWRFKINITNTSKLLDNNEQVFGLTVHPQESDIVVTYGKMHLVVWHFKKDKSIECRTALQMQSKIIKTVYCAEFLNDNSLLTGDSSGNLTIWAPFEVNQALEFAIKEVKGHESQLTCFKLTKDNILISGDKDGAIKTWDVSENEFRLLNAVKLPSLSGSVSAITLPNKFNVSMNIFVGTTNNFILKGSALQTDAYQIIFEGHYMAIRTIAVDWKNKFYTASLDRKICKWNEHGLVWKTDANIQGMSSSVHPGGQVLAVGSASGIITILNTFTGEVHQYIQLSTVCIGCMSYSPNGNFLAAGCQDGSLHVIPVSDNGHSYDKVSILKGPLPILALQWSMDTQFILTSVDDNNYQELILWDLPNIRFIRNVTSFSDNLQWYNVTCSGLEDARGTWDNEKFKNVINICKNYSPSLKKGIVTGDENGYVRLFAYPCFETNASYFQYKQGGGSVTDVKFSSNESFIVSSNYEGSIFLWRLMEYHHSKFNSN